jgi:transcription elongation factor Elf1
MVGPLKAKVIIARCSKNKKCFGIRIEQREKDWVRTWAFPIDERKAKREKFDANTITGSFKSDNEFPGCPHCGSVDLVQCGGCEKLGCVGNIRGNSYSTVYICPWCGVECQIQTVNSLNVSGGDY